MNVSKNFNRFKGLCPLAGGGYAVPSKYSPSPFGGGVGVGAIFGVLTPKKDIFDRDFQRTQVLRPPQLLYVYEKYTGNPL